jgi:hypothetical protein
MQWANLTKEAVLGPPLDDAWGEFGELDGFEDVVVAPRLATEGCDEPPQPAAVAASPVTAPIKTNARTRRSPVLAPAPKFDRSDSSAAHGTPEITEQANQRSMKWG